MARPVVRLSARSASAHAWHARPKGLQVLIRPTSGCVGAEGGGREAQAVRGVLLGRDGPASPGRGPATLVADDEAGDPLLSGEDSELLQRIWKKSAQLKASLSYALDTPSVLRQVQQYDQRLLEGTRSSKPSKHRSASVGPKKARVKAPSVREARASKAARAPSTTAAGAAPASIPPPASLAHAPEPVAPGGRCEHSAQAPQPAVTGGEKAHVCGHRIANQRAQRHQRHRSKAASEDRAPSGPKKCLLSADDEVLLITAYQRYAKLQQQREAVEAEHGRTVTLEELADALARGPARRPDVRALARIEGAGRDAHQMMVTTNQRLVMAMAMKYKGNGVDVQDLVSAGTLGLVRACAKFDVGRGFKFSTYAVWWIRQAIQVAISDSARLVLLPYSVRSAMKRLNEERGKLRRELGRAPSLYELAEVMNMSVDRLKAVERAAREPKSMDAAVTEGGDALQDSLEDSTTAQPEEAMVEITKREAVEAALASLPPKEENVMRMRYGLHPYTEPHTLEDVGDRYSVTRERIRQIEGRTLAKLQMSCGESLGEIAEFDLSEHQLARPSSVIGKRSGS